MWSFLVLYSGELPKLQYILQLNTVSTADLFLFLLPWSRCRSLEVGLVSELGLYLCFLQDIADKGTPSFPA